MIVGKLQIIMNYFNPKLPVAPGFGWWLALLIFSAVTVDATTNAPPAAATNFGGGNNAATEQDHKQMMELLGITSLRRGRDGMNTNSPYYANYDEAKANPFPHLPDAADVEKRGKSHDGGNVVAAAAPGNRGGF